MAPKIFGIGWSSPLARDVAELLRVPVCEIREERFRDGELKLQPGRSVENADVFVFHSLIDDAVRTVNDRLCELYFFLSCLRDLGAARVTAVVPYLCYARSDRRAENSDPLTLRYVAQMLEAAGIDRLLTLDVHNIAAFENAFRRPVVNLEASGLFCAEIAAAWAKREAPVVLSPDTGGIKRAEKFRRDLSAVIGVPAGFAFLEKTRGRQGLEGHKAHGEVERRHVIVYDDMISTGGTLLKAVSLCRELGAGKISVCAAHGLFTRNQVEVLDSPWIDRIVVTDSHPALKTPRFTGFEKLKVLSCASLYADAVRRLRSLE